RELNRYIPSTMFRTASPQRFYSDPTSKKVFTTSLMFAGNFWEKSDASCSMYNRKRQPAPSLFSEGFGLRTATLTLFDSMAPTRRHLHRVCIFISTAGAKTWDQACGCRLTCTPKSPISHISWELENSDSRVRRGFGDTTPGERNNRMNSPA